MAKRALNAEREMKKIEHQLGIFLVGQVYISDQILDFLYRVEPMAHFLKAWHAQTLDGAIFMGAYGGMLRQLNTAYGDSIRSLVPPQSDFSYLHLYIFSCDQSFIFEVVDGGYRYLGTYAGVPVQDLEGDEAAKALKRIRND